MAYFHISTGLRGCYMPNSSCVVQAATRRALKACIAYEAELYAESGYVGANKKAIAYVAACAWRNRKKFQLPYTLPVAPPHARGNYCEGVFVSAATRKEYLDSQQNDF